MRAVVLTAYGDVDKLESRELADPHPGANELVVRVAGLRIGSPNAIRPPKACASALPTRAGRWGFKAKTKALDVVKPARLDIVTIEGWLED